jgi:hypothetical protein
MNGDRSKPGGGGGCLREREQWEKREREKRERGGRSSCWLTFPTSCADCSGLTVGHVVQGDWAASRARADGVTKSHQMFWHD